MVRVRFADELEASIEAGRWSCDNERLERLLNAMRCPWENSENQDLNEAEIASRVLGLKIVEVN